MVFNSIGEFVAQTGADAPTSAERALIDASQKGEYCVLNDGKRPEEEGDAVSVRAGLLQLLITGGSGKCGLRETGVHLEGAWVKGKLNLRFATARGATELDACYFSDVLDLFQAELQHLSLNGSQVPGISGRGVIVAGAVIMTKLIATGEVLMPAAEIGQKLDLGGAELNGKIDENAWNYALNLQRAKIKDSLVLREVTAIGQILLGGAQIGSVLICNKAKIEGKIADGKWGRALNAANMTVGSSASLRDITAIGEVKLYGMRIGNQITCARAKIDGKTADGKWGTSINAQRICVGRSFFLTDVEVIGRIDVLGAQIGGMLLCDGASIEGKVAEGEWGEAFDAARINVKEGFTWRDIKKIHGSVDLSAAHVGYLDDDMNCWPQDEGELVLDGFVYEQIAARASTDTKARLKWLRRGARNNGSSHPQPFTQLARVLRAMGHDRRAREILVARERLMAQQAREDRRIAPNGESIAAFRSIWTNIANPIAWAFDALLRLLTGYGYRAQNSFVALVALFAFAVGLTSLAWNEGSFAPNSDVMLTSPSWRELVAQDCLPMPFDGCVTNPAELWSSHDHEGFDWDTFHPAAYAADLVVPINLGQTDAWAPSRDRGFWGGLLWWARWLFAVFGWIVTALGVASITGIIQKDRE